MIQSFADAATEDLYHGENTARVRQLPEDITDRALTKLDALDSATDLNDLRQNPGARFKKLSGELEGFYSIRVNNQWRIIFQWTDMGVEEVELIDYH